MIRYVLESYEYPQRELFSRWITCVEIGISMFCSLYNWMFCTPVFFVQHGQLIIYPFDIASSRSLRFYTNFAIPWESCVVMYVYYYIHSVFSLFTKTHMSASTGIRLYYRTKLVVCDSQLMILVISYSTGTYSKDYTQCLVMTWSLLNTIITKSLKTKQYFSLLYTKLINICSIL